MLILALDTSSAAGSAAVVRDGIVLAERAGDPSRTHGERLPRELMAVLAEAGAELSDVDRFAVSVGPGSFTGLRVGIATIQGLAMARRTMVTPVSSFEALAWFSRATADGVATWVDAHRGEVVAALFDGDGHTIVEPPTSLTPERTIEAWTAALQARNLRRPELRRCGACAGDARAFRRYRRNPGGYRRTKWVFLADASARYGREAMEEAERDAAAVRPGHRGAGRWCR